MNKMVVVGGVIVLVAAGAISYGVFHKSPAKSTNNSSSSNSSSSNNASSTSMTPSFTINANDSSASPNTVTVKQGATVSLTFNVETNGTYHGGLEFISTDPAVDSGAIATGKSKTISFTATKSFSFQPYWYESQVKKDYLVNVKVD